MKVILNQEQDRHIPNNLKLILEQIYEFNYFDHSIIVRKDGTLCIIKKDDAFDSKMALEKLNDILSALTFLTEIPFFSVNHSNLIKVKIRDEGKFGTIQGMNNTPMARLAWMQVTFQPDLFEFMINIPIEEFKTMVKNAEKLNSHHDIEELLNFHLKASQFQFLNEFNMAFMMSFLIIERINFQKYKKLLDSKDIRLLEYLQKIKAKKYANWSLFKITKAFKNIGELNDEEFEILNELRTLRNDFAHGSLQENISKRNMEICIEASRTLLQNLINEL